MLTFYLKCLILTTRWWVVIREFPSMYIYYNKYIYFTHCHIMSRPSLKLQIQINKYIYFTTKYHIYSHGFMTTKSVSRTRPKMCGEIAHKLLNTYVT
ncbi:hypothetical protein HanIR_Chr14g0671201 [Helianthus annuus]|nr:hypothetical protein HanIR_Chr14g0671201 [Helianthus annuus]